MHIFEGTFFYGLLMKKWTFIFSIFEGTFFDAQGSFFCESPFFRPVRILQVWLLLTPSSEFVGIKEA